ncbi:unnamed protein product [Dracunculus medinensis]|uniref:Uncharacterized protein n=1 Tax=Dracunculus medinensis TaxID=318479 RepID=A0A0N4UAZ6_DRAME|nr:unnamed protein product [Dracunculus medinensis]
MFQLILLDLMILLLQNKLRNRRLRQSQIFGTFGSDF